RRRNYLPRLPVRQILRWADEHHKRTGSWPHYNSGPIPGARGETWNSVHKALIRGQRGLPPNSSLARLLTEHRGVPNHLDVTRLTITKILYWADKHFRRTGSWPTRKSGPMLEAPGETWAKVGDALVQGVRGLPGGNSLLRLFA